jgi:hypothetical protein
VVFALVDEVMAVVDALMRISSAARVLDNAVVRYCWADRGEILDPEPWQVNENGRCGETHHWLLANQ